MDPAAPPAGGRTSSVGEFTDAELLAAFVSNQREDAFAELVRRHGPMVLSVCRRMLGSRDDAQDAFQVTFVILARKAASVRRPEALGSWLFGVARRVARKARQASGRRQEAQNRLITMLTNKPPSADKSGDLVEIVEEEIERLPAQYRMAVVACYLEGKTNREAARALGWPEGTLVTRLNRAKEIIRKRAASRGAKISAAAIGLILTEQLVPASAIPAALLASTARAACAHSAGHGAAAALLSKDAASLLAESSRFLWLGKAKLVALLAMAILVTGTGVALLGYRLATRGSGGALATISAEFHAPIPMTQDGTPDAALLRSVRDLRAGAFAAARSGSGVAQDDGAYDDLGADRPVQDRTGTVRFAFAPGSSVTRVTFHDNPQTSLEYATVGSRMLVYRTLPPGPPVAQVVEQSGSGLDHKPLEWSVAQIARISPWKSDAAFFDYLLTGGPQDVAWRIRRDGDVVQLTIENRRGGEFEERIAHSNMLVEFDMSHHGMTRLFRFERPFTADDGSQKTELQLHRITWRSVGSGADVPVERRVSLASQTPQGIRPRSASVVRFDDYALGAPPADLLSPNSLGIPDGTPVQDPTDPTGRTLRWTASGLR